MGQFKYPTKLFCHTERLYNMTKASVVNRQYIGTVQTPLIVTSFAH